MSSFVPTNYDLPTALLFCFHLKKTAAESHRMLVEAFGEHALGKTQYFEWFKRFKSGDFDVRNEERGRPPKKFEDADLQALLDEDDAQTQQQLADVPTMKEASKKAIPLVTEWLFQTLVERMVYPNRTFTLNLPPPDKKTLEEFLSLDKLNSSVWFSSGVLTLTTSLSNLNMWKAFNKVDKLTYDFNMFFKIHNLSIFYEEWKYITPNETSKGPVRFELQNLGLSMQFIVSWADKPATLKFNKFELIPSDTHIVNFPGAPGLADNETAEMQRLLKASVHSFINTELKEFIVTEKNLKESDPNLEMFRPAFEGTIKLKKVKLT